MSQGRDTPWCLHLPVLLSWDAWSWGQSCMLCARGRTPHPCARSLHCPASCPEPPPLGVNPEPPPKPSGHILWRSSCTCVCWDSGCPTPAPVPVSLCRDKVTIPMALPCRGPLGCPSGPRQRWEGIHCTVSAGKALLGQCGSITPRSRAGTCPAFARTQPAWETPPRFCPFLAWGNPWVSTACAYPWGQRNARIAWRYTWHSPGGWDVGAIFDL